MGYESTVPHARRFGQGHGEMMIVSAFGVPLFGRPGLGEMLLILLAILLLFGGSKLPQLGKGLGDGIRNFKKGLKGEEPEEGKGAPSDKDMEKNK
jgi:sec-independent protein translocase protein TatA